MADEQEVPEIASEAQLPRFDEIKAAIVPPQGEAAAPDAEERKKAYKREWARRNKKKGKPAARDRGPRYEEPIQTEMYSEPEPPPAPHFEGADLRALVAMPMNMLCDRFDKPHLSDSEEAMLSDAVAGVANKYAPYLGEYSVELTLCMALASIVIVRLPLKAPTPMEMRTTQDIVVEPETAAA
jgi:hypothetical protein